MNVNKCLFFHYSQRTEYIADKQFFLATILKPLKCISHPQKGQITKHWIYSILFLTTTIKNNRWKVLEQHGTD